MPIQAGNPISSEQDRQNALLKQFITGGQEQDRISSEQTGQMLAQKQKSALEQERQGANAELLQQAAGGADTPGAAIAQMAKQGSSVALSPEGVHVGAGLGPMKQGGVEAQKLDQDYQKHIQPMHDQVNTLNTGLQGLMKGTTAGDEIASVIKARMVEGKGSRLLGSIIDKFGAPKSLAGDAQGLSNYIKGIPSSKMTPDQRSALADLYEQQVDSIDKQVGQASQQFQRTAAAKSPMLSQSGQLDTVLKNYGNPSADTIKNMRGQLVDFRAGKVGQAPAEGPGVTGQLGDKLKQFLTGGGQQPAQGQQPPMSFEEFKQRKAQGNL